MKIWFASTWTREKRYVYFKPGTALRLTVSCHSPTAVEENPNQDIGGWRIWRLQHPNEELRTEDARMEKVTWRRLQRLQRGNRLQILRKEWNMERQVSRRTEQRQASWKRNFHLRFRSQDRSWMEEWGEERKVHLFHFGGEHLLLGVQECEAEWEANKVLQGREKGITGVGGWLLPRKEEVVQGERINAEGRSVAVRLQDKVICEEFE